MNQPNDRKHLSESGTGMPYCMAWHLTAYPKLPMRNRPTTVATNAFAVVLSIWEILKTTTIPGTHGWAHHLNGGFR